MPAFNTQPKSSNQKSPVPRDPTVGTPVLLQPRSDPQGKTSGESRKQARSPGLESEPASKVLVHVSSSTTKPVMNKRDIRNVIWEDSDDEKGQEELADLPEEGTTGKGGTVAKV